MQFNWLFETSYEDENGSKRSETGVFRDDGENKKTLVVTGGYSYTDTNGEQHIVNYVADENGYRVV